MNNTPSLHVSQFVRASRERVFDAWMDPDKRKAWFVPAPGYTCESCEIEPRVGGRFIIELRRPDDGGVIEFTGEFIRIERPSTLEFTWSTRVGEPNRLETIAADTLVRVELRTSSDGTEVNVRHDRLVNEREGHGRGWTGCLDSLASHMNPEEITHAQACTRAGRGSDDERR